MGLDKFQLLTTIGSGHIRQLQRGDPRLLRVQNRLWGERVYRLQGLWGGGDLDVRWILFPEIRGSGVFARWALLTLDHISLIYHILESDHSHHLRWLHESMPRLRSPKYLNTTCSQAEQVKAPWHWLSIVRYNLSGGLCLIWNIVNGVYTLASSIVNGGFIFLQCSTA